MEFKVMSANKLAKVTPFLVDWVSEFVKKYKDRMIAENVQLCISYGIRTLAEQKIMVANGNSKTLRSKHLPDEKGLSNAIDILFIVNGKECWDRKDDAWYVIAKDHYFEYAKTRNAKVRWGGNFKFAYDMYHYELDSDYTVPKIQTVILMKGDSGEGVKYIQDRLTKLGLYKGTIDGDFGDNTYNAVVAFQKLKGLNPDGKVGHYTLTSMNTAV